MNARNNTRFEPANTVIEAFSMPSTNGATRLARFLNVNDSTVARWRRSKTQRGTSGVIPAHWQRRVFEVAQREGVTLSWAQITGAPDGEK